MRERAVALGARDGLILTETLSNNTQENVLASMLVLDRAIGLHKIHRLLVVSIPWHMRRCLVTLQTYMPAWIEYGWAPAPYVDHQRDNWWRRPDAEACVTSECEKLVQYAREGQIRDIEIGL
jgi:uncharacterized SAM-binding protein YcdF (DUF218 family)